MDCTYLHDDLPWHTEAYLAYLKTRGLPPLRFVGILRISQDKDDSTSIERQKLDIAAMAEERGAVVVGWAEDRDVSAREIPVFKRPQLKLWIDKRSHEFDGFFAWKIDRLTRSSYDTHLLVIFMKDHNKVLWSVMEPYFKYDPNALGMDKAMSELLLNILTMIAEMESENISIRVRSHNQHKRNSGIHPGGRTPYWLKAVKATRSRPAKPGESLTVIPDRRDLMLSLVAQLMAGATVNQLCRQLNADGVFSPQRQLAIDAGRNPDDPRIVGMRWSPETLLGLFRNRLLVGEFCDPEGNIVRNDKTGEPWKYCGAILTHDDFDRLQARLDQLARRRVNPGPKAERLSGKIKCARCGVPLARRVKRKYHQGVGGIKEYSYYFCPTPVYAKRNGLASTCDCTESVVAEALEARIDEYLAANMQLRPLMDNVFVEGSGSHEEMSKLRRAIRSMIAEQAKGLFEEGSFVADIFSQELRKWQEQLSEMERLGVTESRWEWRDTGRTFLDEWEKGDWERRRALLEDSGITIKVDLARSNYYIEDPLELAMVSASEGGE